MLNLKMLVSATKFDLCYILKDSATSSAVLFTSSSFHVRFSLGGRALQQYEFIYCRLYVATHFDFSN